MFLLLTRFVILQGKRPKGRKTLGEKESEFLDALRVSASSQLHSVKSAILLQEVALSRELEVCSSSVQTLTVCLHVLRSHSTMMRSRCCRMRSLTT